MAIAFRAAGTESITATSAATNMTPGLPAGWQPGDIHLLLIEVSSGPATDIGALPAAYTELLRGSDGAGTGLVVGWRRAQSGDMAPSIPVDGTTGDPNIARIIGFSGCVSSGSPIASFGALNFSGAASTTVTALSINPGGTDRMIVFVAGAEDDTAVGSWSGTDPVFVEAFESPSSAGTDAVLAAAYGIRTASTASGNRTATLGTSARNGGALIALIPETATAPIDGDLEQAPETDTGGELTPGPGSVDIAVGQASETDGGGALSPASGSVDVALQSAGETDTAGQLGPGEEPVTVPASLVGSGRVDDRIYIECEHADGSRTRWADDDPDASGIPIGVEVHDTSPGGFADASWGFVRDPRRDWPDLDLIDKVKVYGRTAPLGRSLFEGQQEQFPSEIGESFSIGNQAIGRQRLLASKPYRDLIVDRDPAGWGAGSLARRAVLVAADVANGSDYTASSDGGGIRFDGPVSKSVPAFSLAEMHYQLPAGVKARMVAYKGTEANPTNVSGARLYGSDTDDFSTTVDTALTLDDTVRQAMLSAAKRYLLLLAQSSAAHTPTVPFSRTIPEIGVYGDTDIPLRDVVGDLPGVYGHDALAHVVAPSGLNYTTGPNGTIRDNPSFVIPQLAWLGSGHKRWGAIEEINAWFLWRPEVWEDDTFWWQPWDSDALTWKARIQGGAHWSPAGRQASTLFNGVVVSAQDHAGVERTAGPPGSGCDIESELLQNTDPSNPLNSHGEERWEELNVGYPLTSGPTGSAIQLGYVWMVDHSRPQRSGTLTVRPLGEGHIPQLEHPTIGAVPIWTPRSGDYIDLVDFPDPEPFKVLDRKYSHDSKTATFTLDTASTALSAILARLEVKTASR